MKVATTWLSRRSVPTSCRQRSKSATETGLRLPSGSAAALRAGWVEVELGDGAVEVGAGFRERAAALGGSTGALICRCGVTVACGLFVMGGYQGPVGISRSAIDQRVGGLGVQAAALAGWGEFDGDF